jgi:hypothetical protein
VQQQRDASSVRLQRGIELCRRGELKEGLGHLSQAFLQGVPEAQHKGLASSYLGYASARLEGRVEEGVRICERAAEKEFYEAEVFLNLARVLLLAGERKRAVKATERGCQLDPKNPDLIALRRQLGVRRAPTLPFLGRGNTLNRALGLLRSRARTLFARR